MNILIAPDSFKDSLTAKAVAENISQGIRNALADANIRIVPMADGGEGTVRALIDSSKGEIISKVTVDPLNREIQSFYGILGDGITAVIELAAASGIELLKSGERNPMHTSTYGTGLLIKDALDKGCKKFIIGIGGSATNECGTGILKALGIKILNKHNGEIEYTGRGIGEACTIDTSGIDKRLTDCSFTVACDVTNPLTGNNGASAVYAPQKGASPEMVKELEKNMIQLAGVIHNETGIDITHLEGAGAAGGTGAGLVAFLNARLLPGIEIVKEVTNLKQHCEWADLVITGEGKMDSQTSHGKTAMGVLNCAKEYNKPVIALAGTLGEGYEQLYNAGFKAVFSIINRPMSLTDAINETSVLLRETARNVISTYLISRTNSL